MLYMDKSIWRDDCVQNNRKSSISGFGFFIFCFGAKIMKYLETDFSKRLKKKIEHSVWTLSSNDL